MDEFATCKICGTEPEPQANGMLYHAVLVEYSEQQCPLEASESTPEQWIALMGNIGDAARIEFLAASATMVSGKGNTGIYMLDDVLPYFESEREQCTAESLRAAIDAAMAKEQGNG